MSDWRWPQWVWVTLAALGLLVTYVRHGQQRTDRHDVGVTAVLLAFSAWLLWCGGFFG